MDLVPATIWCGEMRMEEPFAICEILLAGGLETYKKEGSKYLQRMLSHYKKEPSQ